MTKHFLKINKSQNFSWIISIGIYLFKSLMEDTTSIWEICSKLTIKTPKRHWHRSAVFIINFAWISHIVMVFPLLTFNKCPLRSCTVRLYNFLSFQKKIETCMRTLFTFINLVPSANFCCTDERKKTWNYFSDISFRATAPNENLGTIALKNKEDNRIFTNLLAS